MNIRIFFSSPGDVKMERETAKRIVDRLQAEIGESTNIQPYFWEHEVMVATKDYQENIPHMDDFDIVVCILWSRLGTPLDPERHPKPGGGGFKSGTEYEFFTAMKAHELKGTPDIFVFRNTTEPRRPSRPKEVREAVDREIDRLDTFFDTYFQDETFFTRAINIYDTLGEFEEKLTIALRSYITGRIPVSPSKIAAKKRRSYDRQPYLGLASFDYDDAPVFFGRTAQTGEIISVFQNQELEAQTNTEIPPKHFVLILGSSGSGKSSLARAGVLPMLTNPGVIEGANSWRTAIFKPADVAGDPILALVNSLAKSHALPELFADGTKPKELADLIRVQPQGGGLLLRQALSQAGALALTKEKQRLTEKLELLVSEHREEDAKLLRDKIDNLEAPAVRIALLADQLEELFTSDLSPEALNTFIGILVALANSGRVFVLGTLRSDFYPRCLEFPALVELMQGSGSYALPAPSPTDIGQMIRQPAAIAGLAFEEHATSGEKLDELLRDAALKDPAALPLLSYTLEQLYEQRTPDGVLTLDAYNKLGGLEGAIGSRAEAIYSGLPSDAQAAFDSLCKQLVTLQEGGEPTRRRAYYSTLTRTPESKTLVDALVNARLLTADQSQDGERVIAVAHEALLRHWPRIVSWVEDNRLFLNTRTRVASRLADWLEKGKADEYLIPRGPNLSAAESILVGHLASLDPLEIEFIGRSAERIRREDQRRLRNARLITAGAIVLCVFAVAGGIIAMFAKRQAQSQEKIAIAATEKSVKNETRIAYTKGIQLLESGKSREGLTALAQTLAIEPGHPGALARIYSEQLYAMPRPLPVFSAISGPTVKQRLAGAVHGPRQLVIHLTPEDKPAVFDINAGKTVPGPWEKEPDSLFPMISYSSDIVLNIRGDMSLRAWETDTGKGGPAIQLDPKLATLWITMDGKLCAEAKPSGEIRIASTITGEELASWKLDGDPLSLIATGSGYFVSNSATQLLVYDMAAKKLLPPVEPPEGYSFVDAVPAFPREADGDAHRCVVRMVYNNYYPINHRLQFLDTAKGKFDENARAINLPFIFNYMPNADATAVAIAPYKRDVVIMSAFEGEKDIVFADTMSSPLISISPDGQLLAASSTDGTVNVFETTYGKPIFSPAHHEAQVNDLSITADGRHLLTSTKRSATVWDLSTASALTMRVPFSGTPATSHLAGNVLRIKTGDHVSRIDISKMRPSGINTAMPEGALGTFANATIENIAAYLDDGVVSFHDISGSAPVVNGTWNSPDKAVDFWALSPDGSMFAATHAGKLHLVRTSDATTVGSCACEDSDVLALQFSADNRHLAGLFSPPKGSGNLPTLRIWKTTGLEEIASAIPERFYTNFSISPDGRWLSASANGARFNPDTNFLLFDLEQPGKQPGTWPHPDSVASMTYSQDSSVLGVAGTGGTLRVWNLADMSFQDAPLASGTNQIDSFKFSEDFNLIASVSTRNGKSSVRVWDWREACPVSSPWLFDTTVTDIHFSKDGRKLIAIATAPEDDDGGEPYVHIREIIPDGETGKGLASLVQATVAMTVDGGQVPEPTAPGDLWKKIPSDISNGWFLEPPVSRCVSPGIAIATTRWMNLEGLGTLEMTRAMPRVPVSHAKMADWRQDALNLLAAPPNETPEARKTRMDRRELLHANITASVDFAARNSDGDPETCYWLAQQARAAGENKRSLDFLNKALREDPDNENSLHLKAVIATDEGRHADAAGTYEKLVAINTEDVNYRAKYGLSLVETGKDKEGMAELEKIIDQPGLDDRLRALALASTGRHAEAFPVFVKMADSRRASTAAPYDPDSLVYLITANHNVGNQHAAVEFYNQLVKLQPGAADPEIVDGANIARCIKLALLETLEKLPKPSPAEEK